MKSCQKLIGCRKIVGGTVMTKVTAELEHVFDWSRGLTMASSLEKVLEGKNVGLALLQVLAENSFDSIVVTDASSAGKIIYANKAFKKLTGHDPADVLGQTPRILQGPGTDKKVIDRLSSALKAGGRFEGKAINYKKDGTPFIMHWRVLPIKDGKKITAWVAIQREGSIA